MSELVQAATLNGIRLLAPLSPAERAAVARQCRWRRFAPHEPIIDRLSESKDVCFVVEGRVRVVAYSLSGREISFDDIEAGEYLGELSALDGEPRSAAAVALTRCLIGFLAPHPFQELIATHPGIALSVMRRMADIVRRSTVRIMDLSTIGANNRVHAELLRLARAAAGAGNAARISPIPVHGDIASRVSTTRETVARVLSDLARSGIVERVHNALVVHDIERLASMVEDVRGE